MNNGSSQIAVKPSFRGTRQNRRKCHHIDRARARFTDLLRGRECTDYYSEEDLKHVILFTCTKDNNNLFKTQISIFLYSINNSIPANHRWKIAFLN